MRLTFGPGLLVAAAFIGPGTVTACTLAGANFGFALIWTLVFATFATIVLQDMAVRLGVGARLGLGEAFLSLAPSPFLKWSVGGLIFAAIMIGNSAYEGGNLAGGALGMDAVLASISPGQKTLVFALAVIAAVCLMIGNYRILETLLIGLVLIMSLAFIVSFVLVRPDFSAFFRGFVPNLPSGATLTVMALIGTTIVPYNLFLHAASSRQKWAEDTALAAARSESRLSIGLGGVVSILILSTAAASLFQTDAVINNAADMARAIEPGFGQFATYLVGIGLFAAGLTSAITAPMATAYVVCELTEKEASPKSWLFRGIALFIVALGASISLIGLKPVTLILIAQYANGLLLPITAGFLLYVMNQKRLLGANVNSWIANAAGGLILVFTIGLGLRSILRAAGIMA